MRIPEQVNGLPNICGSEGLIAETTAERGPFYLPESGIRMSQLRSGFAQALHMHQPLIPAGGDDLRNARIISNLQYMIEHPDIGDNHNAPVFHWCYKRMGEFIRELVDEGRTPRIMLEYSGCLLHGLRDMGLDDVFESLETITNDPTYNGCVEWLGAPWGHPVAPSTPVQDFHLHVRAWQHHFAAVFGPDALRRVKGFSPSEMALPNHPDVAYEFVRTLRNCGYEWVLVQEHSVETPEGQELPRKHVPYRLVAHSSRGDTASIVAIVKTQGADTKLVAQAQPYYEAQRLDRLEVAGRSIPPLVTQIADGENGGVMMNEFPGKYMEVMRESSRTATHPVNVTEYLEYLKTQGIREPDLPAMQPLGQARIWERINPGDGPSALARAIEQLRDEDDRFHMEGGSWTNDRTWVQGYEGVLDAMQQASARFAEKATSDDVSTSEQRFRNALFHLLTSQTSCFRYWGEGLWTDYGKEICRRTMEILEHDF